jgi:hypothetical protein
MGWGRADLLGPGEGKEKLTTVRDMQGCSYKAQERRFFITGTGRIWDPAMSLCFSRRTRREVLVSGEHEWAHNCARLQASWRFSFCRKSWQRTVVVIIVHR